MMAGYSGTPLVRKLGIRPEARLAFVDPPLDFDKLLGLLPDGARGTSSGQTDFSIVFATSAKALTRKFAQLSKRTAPHGMLWVAWPKKAVKMQTDLTEDVVRKIGLAGGMVDVKVCAVDETWDSNSSFACPIEKPKKLLTYGGHRGKPERDERASRGL